MRGKFILFFSIVSFLVFILASTAYIILMDGILIDNAAHELMKTVELERLQLEASVNSEIAIALKMADSPLIKQYFTNPYDPVLEKMAFDEFAAYRRAFAANSVFWVNDIDKIFYSDDHEPYLVDPYSPDNYWYPMTLFETEIYNFNINYNPDLSVTNLWINAPVFDINRNPLGMVGTGINLSDFINAIFRDHMEIERLYFFNSAREITGAENIELVANKVKIEEELDQIGREILLHLEKLETGGIKFFRTATEKGIVVLCSFPALDWYIAAIQHFTIIDSIKTSMTVLFAVLMVVMMIVVFSVFAVNESRLAKARAEAARDAVISSIEYAGKIQKNILPSENIFKDAFSDYNIIWKPRDIVGGDIYWAKKFDEGTVLCVCDCTGHGTPGALLTMLVVSTFEATVTNSNCKDTANIIWELEKRLVAVLNAKAEEEERVLDIKDGCDLAVLFISKDGSMHSSSSHTRIFICDGKSVMQIKGQKLFIGEGNLKSKDDIKIEYTPKNPDNKFYIASDGLFDQLGGESSMPFCYNTFIEVILENHNLNLSDISDKVWSAFEEYRGNEPRVDDFELITFKP
jgi:hypothetical protein